MKRRKYPSLRLKDYDYSQPGAYFVTVCTRKKTLYLQSPQSVEILSEIWGSLPIVFPTIRLDEFVVLPNHLHFIILLQYSSIETQFHRAPGSAMKFSDHERSAELPPTLGQIDRSFKARATRRLRQSGLKRFAWQRGFYDHIIRNKEALARIREYIQRNPLRWNLDRYNPDAVGVDPEAKVLWEYLRNEDARESQESA